jgi:2,3-dihydroxy-p-cumate/2,3-dihydroxybenzoate 3,4-dioxygenase
MIHLRDISYIRLGTRDVEGAARYATCILGLQQSTRSGNPKNGQAAYFRSDGRDHTLVYFDGDPRDHTAGFEVEGVAELESAAANLEAERIPYTLGTEAQCAARRVGAFINFRDPSGNSIDLCVWPQFSGTRYFPARDAGITGFSHIGLRSTDAARDEAFWTQVLSAKVSDRIGPAPLLRIDPVHHKIALFPSTYAGVQHINHQVAEVDDIMRSWYFLQERGVRIVFGPGRHPTSGARFLYFEGPDGMIYEYSCGVRLVTDPDERPRQFPFTAESFCMWGAKPDIAEFKD